MHSGYMLNDISIFIMLFPGIQSQHINRKQPLRNQHKILVHSRVAAVARGRIVRADQFTGTTFPPASDLFIRVLYRESYPFHSLPVLQISCHGRLCRFSVLSIPCHWPFSVLPGLQLWPTVPWPWLPPWALVWTPSLWFCLWTLSLLTWLFSHEDLDWSSLLFSWTFWVTPVFPSVKINPVNLHLDPVPFVSKAVP